MTPSQRVKCITSIAERLSQSDYTYIDLTLLQFSLPRESQWSGNEYSYVIEMIKEAPDSTLVELAGHVGYTDNFPTFSENNHPAFWQPETNLKIFISHVAKYKQEASDFQFQLQKYGMCGFVAHEDIEPTKQWQNEIELALQTMDVFVAMLTEDFHLSVWTDQEIGFALARGVPIVPIHRGSLPYGFIGKFQCLPGIGKPASTLAGEVFDLLIANPRCTNRLLDAVTQKFCIANCWADAKLGIGLLEKVKILDNSLLHKIAENSKTNDQIYGAFGVSDRVNNLLKKFNYKDPNTVIPF